MVYLSKKEIPMHDKKKANRKYKQTHKEKIHQYSLLYYQRKIRKIPDLDGEEWKPLCGFEEHYLVSNMGRIKSVWHIQERIIDGCLDKDGYRKITLTKPDKSQATCRRARLVALTWIPNTDDKPEVDHINTLRTDDRVCNLRWVSSVENKRNPETKKNREKTDYGFNRGKHRVYNENGSFSME